jgi:hypothetical protein
MQVNQNKFSVYERVAVRNETGSALCGITRKTMSIFKINFCCQSRNTLLWDHRFVNIDFAIILYFYSSFSSSKILFWTMTQ